jgi:hypothetical protein
MPTEPTSSTQTPPDTDNPPGDAGPGLTFDGWYDGLEEMHKVLVDSHIGGLKSALTDERNQRKDLAKQLRDASGKLEQGSEARNGLEAMTANLDEATQRADFYEAAVGAGVKNLKLAYLAAKADGLITNGRIDFDSLKTTAPELFGATRPPVGNAGAGAGQVGAPAQSMNAFIRAAAGRRS